MAAIAILDPRGGGRLQRMLADAGHATLWAPDLPTLLAIASQQAIDAVVLQATRADGASIPDQVRALTRAPALRGAAVLPVLMRSELAERVRCLWYGAANILNLPLQDRDVLTGVASVLDRDRARAALQPVSPAA